MSQPTKSQLAAQCYRQVLPRAYAQLPSKMESPQASVQLLAIFLQESGLTERRQRGNGPARGIGQCEIESIQNAFQHPVTSGLAKQVATNLGYDPVAVLVYDQLANDDVLAACFARLILWLDPGPLPTLGHEAAAWDYYKRNWRPGKPRIADWHENYEAAIEAVGAAV